MIVNSIDDEEREHRQPSEDVGASVRPIARSNFGWRTPGTRSVSSKAQHFPDNVWPLDYIDLRGKVGLSRYRTGKPMSGSKKSRKSETGARSREKTSGGTDDQVDYKLLAEFRLQLRRFLAFSEANAHKNNLTSQQYQALLTIKGLSEPQRNMSVGELADLLLVKHHTAVGLIDRMAKSGLLKRFRDSGDGRRIHVMLTRKGEHKLSKIAGLNWAELRSRQLALPQIFRSFS